MPRSDVEVVLHLLRGQPRRGPHAERLQAFYAPQARLYDQFRERLLHGRAELIERLSPVPGMRVVELGGGTGRNLHFFGERLRDLESLEIVDLCPALLDQARLRTRDLPNVRVVEADATSYQPAAPVDCVFFSYSLTMIPDWRAAMDNALAMLKPNGQLGVVDFYVSAARLQAGGVRHGLFTRLFWPIWFAHDGVRLTPDHLQRLRQLVPEHRCIEHRGAVPYLPGLRVPYYIFLGRTASAAAPGTAAELPLIPPRYGTVQQSDPACLFGAPSSPVCPPR
jgi:S-adenosylmethionine-diacylgycerolhomoserine-N-methlytransferase